LTNARSPNQFIGCSPNAIKGAFNNPEFSFRSIWKISDVATVETTMGVKYIARQMVANLKLLAFNNTARMSDSGMMTRIEAAV
jgi:hypothetical protein